MDLKDFTLRDLIEMLKNGANYLDISKVFDSVSLTSSLPLKDKANWKPKWIIEKFKNRKRLIR